MDFTCLAESLSCEVDGRKGAEVADGLQVGTYVSDLRNRERGIFHLQAGRPLLDVNQAIFIAIHQRTQQHTPDNAEDGRVRAYA